jgi:hypothetical protein
MVEITFGSKPLAIRLGTKYLAWAPEGMLGTGLGGEMDPSAWLAPRNETATLIIVPGE